MQTITTTVLPAAERVNRRIRATHTGDRVAVTIDASTFDNEEEAHKYAAALLLKKLKWDKLHTKTMIGGPLTEGIMVWVFKTGSPEISSWTLRKLELEKLESEGVK